MTEAGEGRVVFELEVDERHTRRVVNAGRTLALTECDVVDGEGKLVARASSTIMRLAASPSPSS